MTAITQQIAEWLQVHFDGTDVYIVDIQHFAKRDKLQVFIDSDSTVGIETCVETSRYLETLLEESRLVGEHYTLEVSSPGVGTPFKQFRQYLKAIGKQIIITLQDGATQEGILTQATEQSVTIIPLLEKSNKKNQATPLSVSIAFSSIKFTQEKIVF